MRLLIGVLLLLICLPVGAGEVDLQDRRVRLEDLSVADVGVEPRAVQTFQHHDGSIESGVLVQNTFDDNQWVQRFDLPGENGRLHWIQICWLIQERISAERFHWEYLVFEATNSGPGSLVQQGAGVSNSEDLFPEVICQTQTFAAPRLIPPRGIYVGAQWDQYIRDEAFMGVDETGSRNGDIYRRTVDSLGDLSTDWIQRGQEGTVSDFIHNIGVAFGWEGDGTTPPPTRSCDDLYADLMAELEQCLQGDLTLPSGQEPCFINELNRVFVARWYANRVVNTLVNAGCSQDEQEKRP